MENKLYTAVASNDVIHGEYIRLMKEKGLKDFLLDRGWGNGYVLVPPCHPYHGKFYDEIYHIQVHGGLTFSDIPTPDHIEKASWEFLDGKPENIEKYWAFGFDTSHYNDNSMQHNLQYVIQQTNLLKNQLEKVYETEEV